MSLAASAPARGALPQAPTSARGKGSPPPLKARAHMMTPVEDPDVDGPSAGWGSSQMSSRVDPYRPPAHCMCLDCMFPGLQVGGVERNRSGPW
jgi:hypothetical protein